MKCEMNSVHSKQSTCGWVGDTLLRSWRVWDILAVSRQKLFWVGFVLFCFWDTLYKFVLCQGFWEPDILTFSNSSILAINWLAWAVWTLSNLVLRASWKIFVTSKLKKWIKKREDAACSEEKLFLLREYLKWIYWLVTNIDLLSPPMNWRFFSRYCNKHVCFRNKQWKGEWYRHSCHIIKFPLWWWASLSFHNKERLAADWDAMTASPGTNWLRIPILNAVSAMEVKRKVTSLSHCCTHNTILICSIFISVFSQQNMMF